MTASFNMIRTGQVHAIALAGMEGFIPANQIDPSNVLTAITDAAAEAEAAGVDRADGAPRSFMRRLDSVEVVKRADALAPTGTLTARIRAILAKPYSGLDGLDPSIIPQRSVTPVGDEYAEIIRTDWTGGVAPYREGQPVPMVDISATPERFKVQHYVCGLRLSFFERQSSVNRLFNLLSMKTNAARNAHARAMNSRVWDGDAASGLTGVLAHPYIPKRIGAVIWDTTSTPDAILADMFSIVDYPADNTADVGSATVLIIASKLQRFLSRYRLTDTSMSVLAYFREQRPGVRIVSAHSLNDKGPNGEHGVVAYNGADEWALYHDLVQPTTFLAPQTEGFKDVVYVYTSDAGVQAFNAYQDLIHWVPTS